MNNMMKIVFAFIGILFVSFLAYAIISNHTFDIWLKVVVGILALAVDICIGIVASKNS